MSTGKKLAAFFGVAALGTDRVEVRPDRKKIGAAPMKRLIPLVLVFAAAAANAQTPAPPETTCIATDGKEAATLSPSPGDSHAILTLRGNAGTFPFLTDGGTTDHAQFVDIHTTPVSSHMPSPARFVIPLDPKATELVVTMLPDNRRMTCAIPGRGR
jgi:hypothetical protein